MRQIAQHKSQGMIRTYFVVAIRDDEHRLDSTYPPAEKFQQVERSFVGPVNILYDGY
jgi:hypothetical protein